jgi:hypothetical protein
MRLHFHIRRNLKNGETEINWDSWFRVRYEASDAAQRANSQRGSDDGYWEAMACTSDKCERRKVKRQPNDGVRYTA